MFEPQHAQDLSDDDKKKALSSLIFLRQKKNGAVKARSCANGNPQREHITKEESAAPMVALDSVFLTSTIDAKENREVVTIDIPGAFLHADNEDYVIMKMVGTLAELMVKTNPKMYRQYVVLEKGRSASPALPSRLALRAPGSARPNTTIKQQSSGRKSCFGNAAAYLPHR